MSHEGHTHDGSEGPGHTHGPPPGAQMAGPAPADPLIQAAIDEQFRQVPVALASSSNATAVCAEHGLEVCTDCGVDFAELNLFSKMVAATNEIQIPPPPNVVNQPRSLAVQKAKEEGNTYYKKREYPAAIQRYDMSAGLAASRFPWEPSALVRDELAIVICNRSAAHFAADQFTAALIDADAVIQLKRPWSKGHFRKAKALVGLGRLEEARDAVMLGLQFEPDSVEMLTFKREIEDSMTNQSSNTVRAPTPQPQKA